MQKIRNILELFGRHYKPTSCKKLATESDAKEIFQTFSIFMSKFNHYTPKELKALQDSCRKNNPTKTVSDIFLESVAVAAPLSNAYIKNPANSKFKDLIIEILDKSHKVTKYELLHFQEKFSILYTGYSMLSMGYLSFFAEDQKAIDELFKNFKNQVMNKAIWNLVAEARESDEAKALIERRKAFIEVKRTQKESLKLISTDGFLSDEFIKRTNDNESFTEKNVDLEFRKDNFDNIIPVLNEKVVKELQNTMAGYSKLIDKYMLDFDQSQVNQEIFCNELPKEDDYHVRKIILENNGNCMNYSHYAMTIEKFFEQYMQDGKLNQGLLQKTFENDLKKNHKLLATAALTHMRYLDTVSLNVINALYIIKVFFAAMFNFIRQGAQYISRKANIFQAWANTEYLGTTLPFSLATIHAIRGDNEAALEARNKSIDDAIDAFSNNDTKKSCSLMVHSRNNGFSGHIIYLEKNGKDNYIFWDSNFGVAELTKEELKEALKAEKFYQQKFSIIDSMHFLENYKTRHVDMITKQVQEPQQLVQS